MPPRPAALRPLSTSAQGGAPARGCRAEGRAAPYFRGAGPAPGRFAPTTGGADARAAFDKVRAETYGLEDEDCQTATPQLDRTIGRELDVVQAVYNHLQWLHAPRASRRR